MSLHIAVAPSGFKESLSAPEAAEAIAEGLRRVRPDAVVDLVPLVDGGEGTARALAAATGGRGGPGRGGGRGGGGGARTRRTGHP
ncbi:glycerate kinase, partial [Streptomyces hydrogenans]|uniref:glycerate kinase n=1 Tax=Streptomyces hydrogenans TaxID=1873719 RepID=UPI0038176A65